MLAIGELRACGLTDREVQGRVRRGTLHRLYRGVFAVGHPNVPLEGRFLAAVKALGRATVLSHYSAAALWGLVRWDDRRIEALTTADGPRGGHEIRVHRTADLPARDCRRHEGIPVTAPERTITDLASALPYKPLRRAVREAFAVRLVSIRSLSRAIERRGTFRGKRALVRILAGARPTRSELEDVVLDLILDAKFDRPDVNVPLDLDGRRVVPDFRWPEQRLIVEADGAQWHDHALARTDDAERQAFLEAHGERLVRVSWHQAISRRNETVARLRAAGAPGYPWPPMAQVSTNQFKNGSHIEVDGTIFKIIEFQHVKPGKGGAFVRTKLRRISDGGVIDKTFRAGEKFRQVRTESRKMQFLYDSGDAAVFMDSRDYEQIELPRDVVGDAMRWLIPNEEADVLFVDERASGVQVPSAVDMTISKTSPGLKGDTASGGGTKPAELETGVTIEVPLFINEGERVRVDTRSGEYVGRA